VIERGGCGADGLVEGALEKFVACGWVCGCVGGGEGNVFHVLASVCGCTCVYIHVRVCVCEEDERRHLPCQDPNKNIGGAVCVCVGVCVCFFLSLPG
jgi:hypothetical protein